jgi:transposase-like protein
MGRPYSTDLRERVLRACEVGEESQAAIARRFEISESAVGSWLRQLRWDGRREPKPHGRGFRSILDEDDGAVLRSSRQRTMRRWPNILMPLPPGLAKRSASPVSVGRCGVTGWLLKKDFTGE